LNNENRLFWLCILFVLIVAGGLRVLSYAFSLPYVDHPDEPAYFVGGQEWRGLIQPSGYYDGIPPAYVALHAVVQPILEAAGQSGLAATTGFFRVVAALVNLATLVVVALSARLAGGALAGIVAGAAWGVAPLVLDNGVYALPDPFIYFFTVLAFWLAALAWLNPKRRGLAVWSVVAGLGAVLMKYPALPALLPGGLVGLYGVVRPPRRWRILATQIVLIGLTGLWLVFIYGVDFSNLQREGAIVQTEGMRNILDIGRIIHNLIQTVEPLGLGVCAVSLGLGILAYGYARRRALPTVSAPMVGMGLSVVIAFPWLVSSYNEVTPSTVRYVLPATAIVCVFLGLSVWQVVQAVGHFSPRWPVLRWRGLLAVGLLVCFAWLSQVSADWKLVQNRRLPDSRVQMRQWFDASLESGTVIVDDENHKTFNPIWGGIPSRQWVDWWQGNTLLDYSLEEWRTQRGMSYAVLSVDAIQKLDQSPEGQAYLEQMLRLRDFGGAAMRGPQMAVFRLWRMQHETAVPFGEAIHLIGYDLNTDRAKAGDVLNFRFYWNASQSPDDNYSLFIHLTPETDDQVLTQADGAPVAPERPTLTWDDPAETLISRELSLTLPADLPAGEYPVYVGLYNFVTGERLATQADGAYRLVTITVSG
jgi:hypothetical protein